MCLAYKKYYKNIDPDIVNSNISSRQQATSTSDNSYDVRYSSLIGLNSCSSLYNDISNESRRIAITRWRLSNHKLRVETGRYTRPKTPRGERTCSICQVIEAPFIVLFAWSTVACSLDTLQWGKYLILWMQTMSIKLVLS